MELVYKHKKWDKQLQANEKVWKKLGGFVSFNNLNRAIKTQQLKLPIERDYQLLYSLCGLNYDIIAKDYYLCNINDSKSIYYIYQSGISAILERLFANIYKKKGRKVFDSQEGRKKFDYHILQMIAIGQTLPKCIECIDNIYVQLLYGNVQSVDNQLKNWNSNVDFENFFESQLSEVRYNDIKMILQGDEVSLKKRLIQRIKEYRKEPIDYFEIIDIYSTAIIKLARIYGMNIDIDVIEIPKLFFDEESCKIDKSKIEVPFFEEALVVLKENGILWDE